MVVKNPVQTTTYYLQSVYNVITFGEQTNIDVQGLQAQAIQGYTHTTWHVTNEGKLTGGVSIPKGSFSQTSSGFLYGTIYMSYSSKGYNSGYGISGTGGSVTNAGLIDSKSHTPQGFEFGIYFPSGYGIVNNVKGATIECLNEGSSQRLVAGVVCHEGGAITNAGAINTTGLGVSIGGGGTIKNLRGGSIYGKYTGVVLTTGAFYSDKTHNSYLDNSAGATISGDTGITFSATNGTVSILNSGSIAGNKYLLDSATQHLKYGYGIVLTNGGAVINNEGGSITGALQGVYVKGASGAVTNAGTITGSTGVDIVHNGSLTNSVGGVITGISDGVYIKGNGVKVTNAGSITGATGSVVFGGAGANVLTLETGSVLTGAAIGSTAAGATNALLLTGEGTASNAFENFNQLTAAAGADWTINSVSTFGAGKVKGELVASADVTFSSTLKIAGGDAIFDSDFSSNVDFVDAGKLELTDPYSGTISSFGAGDVIELLSLQKSSTTLAFSENGSDTMATLTLTQGSTVETLELAGDYRRGDFKLGGATETKVKFV